MKKYLSIVIPIIILIVTIIVFSWIYSNKKEEVSSAIDEEINEVSQVESENEIMNTIVDETNVSSDNLVENVEVTETPKQENNEVKENTSKPTTTSKPSTNKNTSSNKTPTKTETKVEEKKEETKTQNTQSSTETQTKPTPPPENKPVVVERCTNKDNHSIGVGNTGKWFSTKDEAIAYYKSQIKYWGDWWENTDADDTEADATYYKNCPSGYEIWNCMYCSKWTINFYYR